MLTEEVQVDVMAHRGYVEWLTADVFPTLSTKDAAGSLGSWHRLLEWEKRLTRDLRVALDSDRAILNIPGQFDLLPFIRGFAALDLGVLEECPGADADRRILRLAILAELSHKALRAALCTDCPKGSEPEAPSEGGASALDAQMSRAALEDPRLPPNEPPPPIVYARGNRVLVRNLPASGGSGEMLCNGMEGRVVSVDGSQVLVAFSNLSEPQAVAPEHLGPASADKGTGAAKGRSCKHCRSSAGPFKRCTKCEVTFYCNTTCQREDWPTHKALCRLLTSSDTFFDHIMKKSGDRSTTGSGTGKGAWVRIKCRRIKFIII